MKTADLLEHPEVRQYTVYYPSGNILTFDGIFGGMLTADGYTPYIRVGEAINVLDPRCVITRAEGIVFEPRYGNPKGRPKWVTEWLSENPSWPPHDLRKRKEA